MTDEELSAVLLGLAAGLSLVVVGWVVWFTTRLAARSGLGVNAAAGIRTSATTASEAAWRAGHQAALPWARRVAWWAAAVGLFMAAGGVAVLAGGPPEQWEPVLLVAFALGYGGLLLGLVPLVRAADRAARAAEE